MSSKENISISQKKKLIRTLTLVYDRLPSGLRKLVYKTVKPLYSQLVRILSIASVARRPVHLLEGNEKKSGESLNALISGKDNSVAYFSGLLYSEEPSQTDLGKSFIWKVKSKGLALQPGPDLIIIEFDRFYAPFIGRQGYTFIPKWVLFTLEISKSLSELMRAIKNKSLDNNLRKMKKNQFVFEVTRDPEKFKFFYNHMYLPLAEKRFKKASWVFDYHHLKRLLENGQLLLVKRNNDYLAGALLLERGKSLFSHSLGVKEGNAEFIEQGAVTASYYFTIHWAIQRGYEWIDFGYCRPFLRDGVFVYKKRWGMAIKNIKRSMGLGVFGLRICNITESVRSFLAENPFVFVNQDKLEGLVLADQKRPLTSDELKNLVRIHFINGLDKLILVSPHGFSGEARDMALVRYSHFLHLAEMDVADFFDDRNALKTE